MHQLHLVICGRVQGVGFRHYVWRRAREIGVHGFVRNQADGSVEVWGEGTIAGLQELLLILRRGPASARVDEVEETWSEGPGRHRTFEITR